MIKLLICEYRKTRRCHIFLTAAAISLLCLCWEFYGEITEEDLRLGWMMGLYQFPLINSIFLPLLSTVTASRLCGIEHKGQMLKQLCTMEKKGRIFDAKLLHGLTIIFFCVILMWAAALLRGMILGFEGKLPLDIYLLYLLFTLVPTAVIYVFQHSLSMIFSNQAVAFFTGVIGEFAGLFSMFLPNIPWLRRSLIWGYYGVLQFVGLYGWNSDTRWENAYFDFIPVEWPFFAVLLAVGVLIYILGRSMFCKKEV